MELITNYNSTTRTMIDGSEYVLPLNLYSVWTSADYAHAVTAAGSDNFDTGYPLIFTGGGNPVPDESAIGTPKPNPVFIK